MIPPAPPFFYSTYNIGLTRSALEAESGHMEGAVTAGERVAKEVLEGLGNP